MEMQEKMKVVFGKNSLAVSKKALLFIIA